jgi:hypothetical protein
MDDYRNQLWLTLQLALSEVSYQLEQHLFLVVLLVAVFLMLMLFLRSKR